MTDAPSPLSAPSSTGYLPAVLGMVAFASSVASIRHAKDADKAPSMALRIELLQTAARRVDSFAQVEAVCAEQGWQATTLAEVFRGSLGEFDERLRPADWPERLLKTYLSLGLLSDFCLTLVAGLGQEHAGELAGLVREDSFDTLAVAQLLPGIEADAQLAGRLGLWGRRVWGRRSAPCWACWPPTRLCWKDQQTALTSTRHCRRVPYSACVGLVCACETASSAWNAAAPVPTEGTGAADA